MKCICWIHSLPTRSTHMVTMVTPVMRKRMSGRNVGSSSFSVRSPYPICPHRSTLRLGPQKERKRTVRTAASAK